MHVCAVLQENFYSGGVALLCCVQQRNIIVSFHVCAVLQK